MKHTCPDCRRVEDTEEAHCALHIRAMNAAELYVIAVDLDEESTYFAELTPDQVTCLKDVLKKTGYLFSVEKVKDAPGFNDCAALSTLLEDLL